MKSHVFGRKGDKPQPPYLYKGCGLDNVYLLSGFERVQDDDGEGIIIHDMDGLHKAIALRLIREQKVLNGKEVRYLRTYLDLSQSDLGKLLGCDSQSVARYEKQNQIPSPTDRLLRMIVLGHIEGSVDVQREVKSIEEMEDGRNNNKFSFTSTGKGWKRA